MSPPARGNEHTGVHKHNARQRGLWLPLLQSLFGSVQGQKKAKKSRQCIDDFL